MVDAIMRRSNNWQEFFGNKKLIIWGASRGGKQACDFLAKNGFNLFAWCDSDEQKWGRLTDGKPVLSTSQLIESLTQENSDNYVIIIASYCFGDIYRQIRKLYADVPVFVYYMYDPCFLKTGKIFSESEKRSIRAIYHQDEYTTELLNLVLEKGFLNSHQFGHINECLSFSGLEAYYYEPITAALALENVDTLTLLDVGCYNGSSIIQINSSLKGKVKKNYAFEPNEKNYNAVVSRNISNLVLHRMALGDFSGYSTFCDDGPFFHMANTGGETVRTMPLDDLGITPAGKCILKLDVEGSELLCLQGAREFIKQNRPHIAACVYHREYDLLKIPVFLKSLVPDYQFLLRGGMHTVCYAFAS